MLVTLIFFLVIMGRFVLVAGLFHLLFYVHHPHKWEKRKIGKRAYRRSQFKKEFMWSLISSVIFAVTGALSVLLWQKGWLRVYTDVHAHSLAWLPVSFCLCVLLQETYYYWLHRWMHHPAIFPLVHKVHHESNIPSPWTAFSFHPIEAILQAVFLPVFLLVIPMYMYVLLVLLVLMTLSSVINHLDIEIYSDKFKKHFIGRWLIGATHHSLHHKQVKTNFGLYFTFWDKWKGTENAEFNSLFEEKTNTKK